MKKYFLLLLFTIFFANSEAQTSVYHPFPDSNAVWNEEGAAGLGTIPQTYNHWEQRYFLSGDTTIAYKYHKLYSTGSMAGGVTFVLPACQYPIPGVSSTQYQGAIRQDTLSKKVFFLPSGISTDTLLYDFNLNVGDTLSPAFNHSSSNIVVTQIDSFFDGTNYRKQFHFNPNVTIIEGIGSTRGLLWWIDQPFATNELLCFQQNDSTLYRVSGCTLACDIADFVNPFSEVNNSINISPNPFHDKLNVSTNRKENKPSEIIFYDLISRKFLQQKFTNSISLNTSQLAGGLYFYEVRNENGTVVKGKVVKE